MNQKELTLLYSYILNNQLQLKDEIRHLQSNLRFRNVDTVDCLELAFAIERYNNFREITKQIKILLNLEGKK